MRYKLLIFFLCLTSLSVGQVNTDSIRSIWVSESNEIEDRLDAMYYYSTIVYLRSNPDSAFLLANHMYDLAERAEKTEYQADALRIQGTSFFNRGNISEALEYYSQSLRLSEKSGYLYGTASAFHKKGKLFAYQGEYQTALENFNMSMEIYKRISNKTDIADLYADIGIMYYDQGNFIKTLEYFEKCLVIYQELGNKWGMARVSNNMGVLYHEQGNTQFALPYFEQGFQLFEEVGELRGMASSLNNIGDLYATRGTYNKALEYNFRSLKMRIELGDKRGMANCYHVIGDNYSAQGKYEEALENYNKSLEIREELGERKVISQIYGDIGKLKNQQGSYNSGLLWCNKAYQLSIEIGAIREEQEACVCLYEAYKGLGIISKALLFHERYVVLSDSLKADEITKRLQQIEFKKIMVADSLKMEEDKLRVELIHVEEVNRSARQRNFSIAIGIAVLFIALALWSRLRYTRRTKAIIESEKERSENLLLNILPAEVAEELKATGEAEARNFDDVTVLFSDIKGFTQTAEKFSAKELVAELNICFIAFDEIVSRHKIEKIKTIGDAYMAAGGIPAPVANSALNVVLAAIEMQQFIAKRYEETKHLNKPNFEMRVGVHTGYVIAGIVGAKKFQYDIWGDTVNTASRMESSGKVGEINISQTTYERIKDHPEMQFVSRGKVHAKGKGEIEMYFVNRN